MLICLQRKGKSKTHVYQYLYWTIVFHILLGKRFRKVQWCSVRVLLHDISVLPETIDSIRHLDLRAEGYFVGMTRTNANEPSSNHANRNPLALENV